MNSTTGWLPEPTVRGTFSILSAALATTIICAWTAVHLNLPGIYDKKKEDLLRQIPVFFAAIIAPDGVLISAGLQLIGAMTIVKAVRAARGEPPLLPFPVQWWHVVKNCALKVLRKHNRLVICLAEPRIGQHTNTGYSIQNLNDEPTLSNQDAPEPFTTTHGYLVLMGGFAFELDDTPVANALAADSPAADTSATDTPAHDTPPANDMPPANDTPALFIGNRKRLAITSTGMSFIAQYDPVLIPNVSSSEIADRAKATPVSKLICCY
jgi:hypothetical protein